MPSPETSLSLRAPRMPATSPDGRRGKPFSVRLDDVERNRLAELQQQAAGEIPWRPHRHRSLGAFVVWAALQWKPGQQKLALSDGTLVDGAGRVVGRRLGKPKFPKPTRRRRRRGTTRRPGRRAPLKKKRGRK